MSADFVSQKVCCVRWWLGQWGGISTAGLLSRSLSFTLLQGRTWDCDSKNNCNNIVDIVLESCHSGHVPSLFQHLPWSLSGIQSWCLWLFYSMLPLAVSGSEVASLPCVHASLLSVLTVLFFSEVLTPRIREAQEGGEKYLLPPTACSQVHQWNCSSAQCESHCPFCTAGWGGMGDVLSFEDSEWSMPDRGCAEDSSQFRCQTQYLITGIYV